VADVFGLPVQRLQINEAAAMGAALLGGAGLGFLDAEQTSRSWAKYDPSLEPNSSNMDRYQAMLETFRGLYLKTRVDFTRAQDLSD
jgi:xylulokinase